MPACAPAPPTLVGDTLVVQTSNHLQTLAYVDFFVKGDDFSFQDGNNETISIPTPKAGRWRVVFNGFVAFTGASLMASREDAWARTR